MRGSAIASAIDSLRSMTLTITCSTVVMMRLPPGEPVTRNGLPSLSTMVGVIDESGLARSRRVGVAADETIGVGRARLGGEVVELVVEQDAGALGDETEAVAEVERGGIGHRVAEAIDH